MFQTMKPKKDFFQSMLLKITLSDKEKGAVNIKKAFLEEAAILFENFEVKIGCKTNLIQTRFGPSDDKKTFSLCISIYYCNKNKFTLEDCAVKFDFSKSIFFNFLPLTSTYFFLLIDINNIKVHPLNFEFSIPGNSNFRQDFLVENFYFNQDLIILNFSYK